MATAYLGQYSCGHRNILVFSRQSQEIYVIKHASYSSWTPHGSSLQVVVYFAPSRDAPWGVHHCRAVLVEKPFGFEPHVFFGQAWKPAPTLTLRDVICQLISLPIFFLKIDVRIFSRFTCINEFYVSHRTTTFFPSSLM